MERASTDHAGPSPAAGLLAEEQAVSPERQTVVSRTFAFLMMTVVAFSCEFGSVMGPFVVPAECNR